MTLYYKYTPHHLELADIYTNRCYSQHQGKQISALIIIFQKRLEFNACGKVYTMPCLSAKSTVVQMFV